MVVDGIAVGIWAAPRATVDLDFLIGLDEERLPKFIESARKEGMVIFDPEPVLFKKMTLLRMFLKEKEAQLLMLDFILTRDDYSRESLRRAVSLPLKEQEIMVASPEDVILLKLLSGRGQDRVDIENIIRMRKDSIDRNYLQHWAGNLSTIDLLNQIWNQIN